MEKKSKKIFFFSLAVLLGILSGFLLSRVSFSRKRETPSSDKMVKKVTKGLVVGSSDEVFKDKAVGILQRNEGEAEEGTHKLIREGGPSQTAYLISSVIDLDKFVGHKVEVWGQTFYSDKVGWLMDVGRLKVLK